MKTENTTPENPVQSKWTGSKRTYSLVRKQIGERWGEEAVKAYDPQENCLTFRSWIKKGYAVKKGEKALRSFTFVEVRDEDGEVIEKVQRPVFLFYQNQVEKREPKKA